VIRHDYVSADRDIVIIRALAERKKRFIYLGSRKNGAPSVGVVGDEIERPDGRE
jgi:hypothetical protein